MSDDIIERGAQLLAKLDAALDERDHMWRCAEATAVMYHDALIELHAFVVAELDHDPEPIESYLAWPADRIAELRKDLAARRKAARVLAVAADSSTAEEANDA